ncbi:MAG: GGDEF domain-containing protein, partial [Colwellia sp.]|nr:GGDEF domain-containing protein [Colwellia sp.]
IAMFNRIEIFFLKEYFEDVKKYLPLFEQAVEIAGDATLLGDVYRYKAMMALHEHNYPLAKSLLHESKLIYQAHDLAYYTMLSDLVLLEVMLTEGDFSTANSQLLKIKADVTSYANAYYFVEYYQMATAIYQALNDYKSAFAAAEHLKKYELLLAEEKNRTEIVKFEYEQSLKTQQSEKANMKAQQIQQNIIWALIVIASLLTLCFLLFILNRQMSAKQKLGVLANTDMLTGAPNRRAILDKAEQQLKYCKKNQLPLIIVMADIDLFKSINDEFGHDVGDEVLRVFSNCSKEAIRQSEFYGRFGGEEWLFIIPQTELSFAQILFERLSQSIQQHGDEFPFDIQRLTFSMGAVELEKDDTVKAMIDRADKLLYQAKEQGRNRICY